MLFLQSKSEYQKGASIIDIATGIQSCNCILHYCRSETPQLKHAQTLIKVTLRVHGTSRHANVYTHHVGFKVEELLLY